MAEADVLADSLADSKMTSSSSSGGSAFESGWEIDPRDLDLVLVEGRTKSIELREARINSFSAASFLAVFQAWDM